MAIDLSLTVSNSNPMWWVIWSGGEYYLHMPGGDTVASIDRVAPGLFHCQVYGFGPLVKQNHDNIEDAYKFCEELIASRLHTHWTGQAKKDKRR
jgi:hypothetical protein